MNYTHSRLSRLIKTPKLHVGDTGIACALLNRDSAALWEDRALLGQMLETFIYQELRRQASWQEDEIRFHHFRFRRAGTLTAKGFAPRTSSYCCVATSAGF